MREVLWTDEDGLMHRSLVRDSDADSMAPYGHLLDPPILHELDCDTVRRRLHNLLVEANVLDWDDLVATQNAIVGLCVRALKPEIQRVLRLAKENAQNG